MNLTKRDHDLFIRLCDYGLMTTRQVGSMSFPGVALTTVLRRLRKLESHSYIQRVAGLESNEVAWAVTGKIESVVGERSFKRHFRRDTLEHDLKLTSLRLALEGNGLARSWISEHEIRSRVARRHGLRELKNRIVPDGLMGIRVSDLSESVAVELELNFKNQDRYRRTFGDYSIKQNLWAVWYVVASASLGRHLEKLWRKFRYSSTDVKFIWTIYDEVIAESLNASVKGLESPVPVGKLWTPKTKEPARAPALKVSRLEYENALNKTEVSIDRDEEKLAPAS